MDTPLTVYTIGHSNLGMEEFLALLRLHKITILLDIRSAPYSRYVPHFNKNQLGMWLPVNGVDYRYAGDFLGGQPKDESVYKNEEIPAEGTKRQQFRKLIQYEAVMQRDWYVKGINRLLEIPAETAELGSGVVIMCSEGNPLECHRHHLIARSLLDPAVKVVDTPVRVEHIVKGGRIERVDPSAFTDHNIPRQDRLF